MFGFVSRCELVWTLVIHTTVTWVRDCSRKWQRRAAAVASGVTERNPSVRGTTVTTATRPVRASGSCQLFREHREGRSAHFLLK